MSKHFAKHLRAIAMALFALAGAAPAAAVPQAPTYTDIDRHDAMCMLSMPVQPGGIKAYSMMMFFFGRIVGRHPEARFNAVTEYALPYFAKLSTDEQNTTFLNCQSEFNTIYQSK